MGWFHGGFWPRVTYPPQSVACFAGRPTEETDQVKRLEMNFFEGRVGEYSVVFAFCPGSILSYDSKALAYNADEAVLYSS